MNETEAMNEIGSLRARVRELEREWIELRSIYGAKESETFRDFVGRLVAEAGALREALLETVTAYHEQHTVADRYPWNLCPAVVCRNGLAALSGDSGKAMTCDVYGCGEPAAGRACEKHWPAHQIADLQKRLGAAEGLIGHVMLCSGSADDCETCAEAAAIVAKEGV